MKAIGIFLFLFAILLIILSMFPDHQAPSARTAALDSCYSAIHAKVRYADLDGFNTYYDRSPISGNTLVKIPFTAPNGRGLKAQHTGHCIITVDGKLELTIHTP